ncbi:bifunctional 2-polyprenyl-6-hydroxyphenol methylase/3-demethylubiquinol 3-O-methyltransferase UbiG [Ideonella sp. A 288]|uniref:class I SAM-dependent methyltransferase n=1 Tax=Ideonella sp. A 288 TaxID=1962181 RepID=UPI001302F486|nr:class I SAM-dependent methyltransferase [Ideonella sp. A 288]
MAIPGIGMLKGLAARALRLVMPHDGRDNSAYWRGRAAEAGSAAVLWRNATYNGLVREREFAQIAPVLAALPPGATVLDIGCGIGEVARWIIAQRADLRLTGVDFPEMVERARREWPHAVPVEWVGASADEFVRPGGFDLVLSSGCYSAIRDRAKCVRALEAGCAAVKPGGVMLLIDPFHTSKYLARVRMGPAEVIDRVQAQGLHCEHSGGILFWPFREFLSNSRWPERWLPGAFALGERLLPRLGERLWSDYKVLRFRKPLP